MKSWSLPVAAVLAAASGSAYAADCLSHIPPAEQAYQIPRGLLQAIAQVESGANGAPQPWAIAVGRRSLVLSNRDEAAKVVRSGPGKGMFVGCMQLSVEYHHGNFDSTTDMLEPAGNVDYGAALLAELKDGTGSWTKAVQRYQGGKEGEQRRYLCKVAAKLRDIHRPTLAVLNTRGCGPNPRSAQQEMSANDGDRS